MNFQHRKSGITHAGRYGGTGALYLVLDCMGYSIFSASYKEVETPVDCATCLAVARKAGRQQRLKG